LLGQWGFTAYLLGFYVPTTATGNFEAWLALRRLGGTGYVEGDLTGNLTFAAHALSAAVIAFGGGLQLIPTVRRRWPRFHRWNGRVFLVLVLGLSLSGFYLVWFRGTTPNALNAIGTSLNGVLILGFGIQAWRKARARDFVAHRRWAIRLYLVSNAQWFLRIGMMAWFAANVGLGRKVSSGDPFVLLWTFGCYLVPLAVSEAYLRSREGSSPAAKRVVAALLALLILPMLVGIVGFGGLSWMLVTGATPRMPG
jgi:hypothetical protein